MMIGGQMAIRGGDQMSVVPVTSSDLDASEVSFFSALCSDDFRYLGVPDGGLRSSWAHCSQIVKQSEANGFRNSCVPPLIRWARTR